MGYDIERKSLRKTTHCQAFDSRGEDAGIKYLCLPMESGWGKLKYMCDQIASLVNQFVLSNNTGGGA
jgi:hypothetical protein